jgi:hypothetical protein
VVMLAATGWTVARSRSLDLWGGAYLRAALRRRFRGRPAATGPVHVLFCVADHFEPALGNVDGVIQQQRVERWARDLPLLADRHRDADGVRFQYTFFYPEEQYRPELLTPLAALCHAGYGDVEVHLHHDGDSSTGVRQKLLRFTALLHQRHGLLRRNVETGRIEYGFIHGDWALDNSGAGGRCCGVNDEISVLRETGCYGDFTFPSAPDRSQPRTINSIYYATDDPGRPKSHDRGEPAAAGRRGSGDLLMVQGPLTLNWRRRSYGLLPRVENGELSGDNPPTPQRADLWVGQGVHVQGRPEWIFVKVHTHGAYEPNADVLLGEGMRRTLMHLERNYNDGVRYRLHYMTAREIHNVIKAAEAGRSGDPGQWRRFGEGAAQETVRCATQN